MSDVIALQWELLRWRRFKFQILEGRGRTNLRKFLQENLSYDLYEDHFARILAEFLRENLPEDEVDQAEKLARGNAREEPDDADDKVLAVLEETDTDRHYLLAQAQAEKAIELVAAYTKRERGALALVTQLLDAQGLTISSVLGDGCTDNLESIERLDQLCAVAESRRNAALRELERRRAALAADLRRGLITAEEAQFEEVETAPTPLERAKAR
ncbi:MAG: hypothetical protein ACJ8F3_01690 [Xanthobacteraceae bacterium]